MKLYIYAIYDSASKAYMSPFFMHNNGLAIRAFSDQVNAKQENQISNHPEQFTLFKIGLYEDSTGNIEPENSPVPLGKGNEFKEEIQQIDELKSLINEFKELVHKEK